jgi:phosphatidylserine/phosphatidylglycerophosphate/cardiolipin synthase-like enzyme
MRSPGSGDFPIRAIAGTHVVLMAWDLDIKKRVGLRGFAIERQIESQAPTLLKGLKYFKSLLPNPVAGATYSSRQQPFQTFLWSDYGAEPEKDYTFTVVALYGDLGSLEERYRGTVKIRTEKENDGRHGVWFNRGAIASHALAAEFQNRQVTDAIANMVDEKGIIADKEAKWLSRGLAEACIRFINGVNPGEALRICAYEFTYPPILDALKRALGRGVDVRIVYHFTKKPGDLNAKAIAVAKLPKNADVNGKKTQILFQRTRTQIPHNKFMVKIVGGKAREVWTGSTNFTSSGFLGQTNVAHLVIDPATADTYWQFWKVLSGDPTHSVAVTNAVKLTPNPPNAIGAGSIALVYSPRVAQNMLYWYAARVDDAASLAMTTLPFNVASEILSGLAKSRPSFRLVILENPPTADVIAAEKANQGGLLFSSGAILGKQFVRNPRGGAKVVPIAHSPVDHWFIDEELARPVNKGHVFFVHSKILLIDPLSNDPLLCSGSANFSKNSLIANDENMLLIRGETRVADIYLTEFDRIFRHFYARDAINRFAQQGNQKNPLELDETSAWIDDYFRAGAYKNNRRLLFFPDLTQPTRPAWAAAAAQDADVFTNERKLAAENRSRKGSAKSKGAKRSKSKGAAQKRAKVEKGGGAKGKSGGSKAKKKATARKRK